MKFRTGYNYDSNMIVIEASPDDFISDNVFTVAIPLSSFGDQMALSLQGAISMLYKMVLKNALGES